MADHPLKSTDFLKFIDQPVQRYILRIIPANAELSEQSGLKPHTLGKIPGRYNRQTGKWAGWTKWQNHATTKTDLEFWETDQNDTGPYAAGCRTGDIIIVIDLDSDDAAYIAMVRRLAEKHLGDTGVIRCRDGAVRIQLFYNRKVHTPPITKQVCSYLDAQGTKHLTEVLGAGQQTVIEGPHAKGAMHYWESFDLVNGWGADERGHDRRDRRLPDGRCGGIRAAWHDQGEVLAD